MKIKAMIANADMDVFQLVHDILEINFRDVEVVRAMNLEIFWKKVAEPCHVIILSVEFIMEEQEGFIDRLKEANPDALGNVIVIGEQADFDKCSDEVKQLPFVSKPFSLDDFEEVIKAIQQG